MKACRLIIAASALILCLSGAHSSTKIPQPSWPNLDVLNNYPNEDGDTCPLTGRATATAEKKKSNALKNRYKLPADGFDQMLLSKLFEVPSGSVNSPPSPDHADQQRAVTIIGYVREVSAGGTRGESCNCKATRRDLIDTHIEFVLNPNNTEEDGKGMVVGEVTERIRRLARMGLLESNIGNDWSLNSLRAQLLGRWVKVSGYLFYDADHHKEAWRVDPQNNIPNNIKDNWRETGWEIHPIMAIETNVLPPTDAERMSGRPTPTSDEDDGDNPNRSLLPIIGNSRSRLYHLPECPGYSSVSPRNRIQFRSEQAARQAGYNKAGNCP